MITKLSGNCLIFEREILYGFLFLRREAELNALKQIIVIFYLFDIFTNLFVRPVSTVCVSITFPGKREALALAHEVGVLGALLALPLHGPGLWTVLLIAPILS